ncbi:hypothetical protein BKA69DRAFT_1154292 [Paraphysoderma sedebokerense]|nr:hypothetical protein BKA69DRAFT_1154292 [Paraphysoderma sedebokerense]
MPVDNIQSGSDKYTHVALGGTFDHLHAGHKILLTMAAWISDYKLLCGIVAPSMLKSKKFAQQLESLEVRIAGVLKFLGQVSPKLIPSAVPIYDPHGPASTLPDLDVIVVSEETIAGAGSINEAREKNGLKPLDVRVIAVISESKVGEESMDLKISSTGIRKYLDSLSREHSS